MGTDSETTDDTSESKALTLVGVPMDLGADRRGVDMGPSALRYAGLAERLDGLGFAPLDAGDVSVPRPERRDPDAVDPTAKYLAAIRTACRNLTERVAAAREADRLPLVLGGDHSIAIGTAAAVAEEPTGVVWFDAHADFNTPETTPSGNVHGMGLAALLGEGRFGDGASWARAPGIEPENVAIVGVRDLDSGERTRLRASDVTVYTMTDIDRRGISTVVGEAIEIATADTDRLYASLDMDVLDPSEAPGVGTPVRGGISYREAHAAMELLYAEAPEPCALELVEVNPILDRENRTAALACELAASALGERIL
jgi:arginase